MTTKATENTPVTITLPLGLVRTVVVALAVYADETEKSRRTHGNASKDSTILQLIVGATDAIRDAASTVDPNFDDGVAMMFSMLAPDALFHIADLKEEGKLTPAAITAELERQEAPEFTA